MRELPAEPRHPNSHVLGLVMDEGPLTATEASARLYPQGTHGRGDRKGTIVAKDPKGIRRKLNELAKGHRLRCDEKRFVVHPDLGRVWVIYVGSERGFVGVYDASLQPMSMPRGSADPVALRVIPNIGQSVRLDSEWVLNRCLSELADIVRSADGDGRKPGALVIGLPAALSRDNRRVHGEGPESWMSPETGTIDEIIESKWKRLRRDSGKAGNELPDLPRSADRRLALTADADIVLDTLGAMHDPTRFDVEAPDPRLARVVLGVKHSVGIRSTVVSRGPADLHLDYEHRRPPGQRRDSVYRGAFGDTVGLGHSIALIQRANRKTRERADDDVTWEDDVTLYHERRVKEGRPCSCGTYDPPHLNQVASYSAVEERLKNVGLGVTSEDIWGGIDRQIAAGTAAGIQAQLILEETGRLLAYALDNGVRLYDPDAIVVTGKMAFNHTFWNTVLSGSFRL